MAQFFIALGVFLILHIVPTQAGIRGTLVGRYGEANFRIGYSILSLTLIVWVIAATLQAPRDVLWMAESRQYTFALHLMPWACAFLFAAIGAPNPLSVAFSGKEFNPAKPGIVAITRHPVLWGFGLWALAHIPANGDLVSLTLFGAMMVFAFAGMKRIEGRKRKQLGAKQYGVLARSTSVIPFLAVATGRASFPFSPRLWLQVVLGLAFYAWFVLYGHLWLIGADPLAFHH